MDIELDIALDVDGMRKRLGRAVIKDVDPAAFAPYEPVDTFQLAEHYMGLMIFNGWPGRGRLVVTGRVVPAPHEIDVIPPDVDIP